MGHVPDQNQQNQHPDSGRHRVDGDYEYYESIEESSAAAAGAATGSAAGSDGSGEAGNGVPLRGLAMVLIFIAILLAGWGFYSMFTGDSEDVAVEETEVTVEEEPVEPEPAPAPEGDPAQEGEEAPLPDGDLPDDAEPEAPAPADRGATNVLVLNNSTFPGWAEETGGMLHVEQNWARVSDGNLAADNTGIMEPTVFYNEADPAQRAAAEEIAAENNWVAAPRTDLLGDQPMDAVVIVMAGER